MERVEPYRTLLEPMWQEAQDGNLTIVSSPVLVVEALVKPLRDGNTEIEMQYRELFESNAVRLLEASYAVFEDAARPACHYRVGNTRRASRRDSPERRLRAVCYE